MAPQAVIALLVVIALPVAWLISEYRSQRSVRVALGIAALLSTVGVAWLVGSMWRWNYNAWYGGATQELIGTTIEQIENGKVDQVVKVLRRVDLDYRATYENRAHYDEVVREAVKQMSAETVSPGSKWDTSPFTRQNWVGHWEDETGFWLVISDGSEGLSIRRSGDGPLAIHTVSLSADALRLTFSEGDKWIHELTIRNKYEAEHVWIDSGTGHTWKTEAIHKLIQATPEQRQFTQIIEDN